MKVRHMVAASMIGIVGVLGPPGVASAQTAPRAPNTQAFCTNATARVSQLEARVTRIEQQIATLQARLATGQSNKHRNNATSMQRKIREANRRHDRLSKLTSEINTRCAT